MDFDDLREYVRGDDVKDIDWKASARSRTRWSSGTSPARKHTVLLAVSTGRSMAAMNDVDVSKRDLAVMVAGVVGYLAIRHGDLVAGAYGDAAGQRYLKPSGGELGLERFLAGVHDATRPDAAATDLEALPALRRPHRAPPDHPRGRRRRVRRHSRAVLGAAAARGAARGALRDSIGDLDPTAAVGTRALVDVDSGRAVPAWAQDDPELRREFGALLAADTAGMRRELDALGIVHERVHDDASAIAAIFALLERHRHARRR